MTTTAKVIAEFQKVVNAMTNWQRHQWCRAKYPGLVKKEVELVRPFLNRKRPDYKSMGRSKA